MKKKPKVIINNGAEFGLFSDSDLRKIKNKVFRILISLGPWPEKSTFHLPPEKRKSFIVDWSKNLFEKITKDIKFEKIKLEKNWSRYTSFAGTLTGDQLLKLKTSPFSFSLTIIAIDGIIPKRQKRKRELGWYSVLARFVIQIEEQVSGLQTYENRIILVKAFDFDDAEKRVKKEFSEYATPYLNPDCKMVRWQFDEVIEIYHTHIKNFDPNGTEVFSCLKKRRMKPEYVWNPRKN